jgi:mono/diheme cytochrome c family protein
MDRADILPAQRRENPEPHERTHPVPWYVLCAVVALTVFGALYIGGEPVRTPSHWGDGREAGELRPPAQAAAGSKADGAAVYASRCAACHQADGKGLPGVFPPLAGSEWVQGDASRLAAIVLQGVNGPIEVRGVAYSGSMPAFRQQLDDEQLAALLGHVRSQWGNASPAPSAAAVATAREKLASTPGPFAGGAAVQAWGP